MSPPTLPPGRSLPKEAPGAGDAASGRPLTLAERAARSLAEGRHHDEPPEIRLLTASLDEADAIRSVVAHWVPQVADWCFLYMVDAQGIPRRVQVGHADPTQGALAARFRAVAPGPGWANLASQAIRDRTPRLFQDVTPEVLRWAAHDDDHLAALTSVAPRSILVLPFVSRDRVVGAVTLMRCADRLPFSEEDLVAATRTARPLALVLDNARAVTLARAARREAEQAADVERHHRLSAERALLRLRRLESLVISLSAALTEEAAARLAFEGGLALLEPRLGAVALARAGVLELVSAPGWPLDLLERWRTIPADAPSLMAEAWRTQRPIWLSSERDLEERYGATAELARALDQQAWAAVPILADDQPLGALVLGFDRPRALDEHERAYVTAIAALIGMAAARARLRAVE